MTKKRKIVITKNKEIYNGLNRLHYNNEILLKSVKKSNINRIVQNINKHEKCLSTEIIGDYILVKKLKPLNFKIYLS